MAQSLGVLAQELKRCIELAEIVPAPLTIWLTGVPASGKSTIAEAVRAQRHDCALLDSDVIRKVLTPSPTYDDKERDFLYRSIALSAYALNLAGANVLIAATAHKRQYRETARQLIPQFFEVYVRCSFNECIRRDPKGLYRASQKGELLTLPVHSPNRVLSTIEYEVPSSPDLILDTERSSVRECAAAVMAFMEVKRAVKGQRGAPPIGTDNTGAID